MDMCKVQKVAKQQNFLKNTDTKQLLNTVGFDHLQA